MFDYLIVESEERVVDSEQNFLPVMHNFCNLGNVTQTDQGVRRSLQEDQPRVSLQGILHVLRVSGIHVRSGDARSSGYLQASGWLNCVR